ncbi:MAG: SsrA-binding protein SmpB [Chloroflexota bacterium]|nr:SsrA-binding protein SmpB [Chloroflexota bacterium]
MATSKDPNATLAVNRKARHDYFIEDTMEAGLVLKGAEIKSMRDGKVNLRDSFVIVRDGEAWVRNMHVSPYNQASTHDELDPLRPRKLLLHKRQIRKLDANVSQKGMTIVPLRLYLKDNRAKLEIGIAKGKKAYDKRDTIAERESKRKIERALRGRY